MGDGHAHRGSEVAHAQNQQKATSRAATHALSSAVLLFALCACAPGKAPEVLSEIR